MKKNKVLLNILSQNMLGHPEIQLKRGFARRQSVQIEDFWGRFSSNCAENEKILFELQNCKEA